MISKLRILGRMYQVVCKHIDGVWGQCDHGKGVITYVPEQSEYSQRDTVLHEAMHAILTQQGYAHPYKLEESFVRPLATGIVALLQDNPEFAKWLIKKADK